MAKYFDRLPDWFSQTNYSDVYCMADKELSLQLLARRYIRSFIRNTYSHPNNTRNRNIAEVLIKTIESCPVLPPDYYSQASIDQEVSSSQRFFQTEKMDHPSNSAESHFVRSTSLGEAVCLAGLAEDAGYSLEDISGIQFKNDVNTLSRRFPQRFPGNATAVVSVDLNASDSVLKAHFASLLIELRRNLTPPPKRAQYQSTIQHIRDFRIIELIDLLNWAESKSSQFRPKTLYSGLLNADPEQFRKTIIPLTETAMNIDFINYLANKDFLLN